MSATFISQTSGAAGAPISIAVQIGDLIVVGSSGFLLSGSYWASTVADSAGNSYLGGWTGGPPGAFGFVSAWYAFATSSGTIAVTLTAGSTSDLVRVGVYRGAGPFDQMSTWCLTGSSTPFTFADSLIVTLARDGMETSTTGDTQRSAPGDLTALWDRSEVGPGNGFVNLGDILVSMVFSSPVTRPGGTTAQYACRAGSGHQSDNPVYFSGDSEGRYTYPNNLNAATNRPLTASFAYPLLLDSIIVVGVATAVNPGVFTITDNAGNVYTKRLAQTGSGVGLEMWTTVVGALPAAGHVFQVTMTETTPSTHEFNIYQFSAMAIAEYTSAPTPSFVDSTGYLSSVISVDRAQVVISSNSLISVPAGTLLVAFAMYGENTNQLPWTALGGYTKRTEWNFIQFPQPPGTNFGVLGNAILMDQLAPSTADYDAEAQGDFVAGSVLDGNSGAIGLLGVTLVGGGHGLTATATCSLGPCSPAQSLL